ncbi:MAG: low molecular weight phosphotyrosine protein phosphatase [Eubacterium sp.]|nr:low molecular weight phosphotyrosine protein phosphatase [Eubacterium sp.]
MIKILFICHGNICRSPIAEYVMKDLVQKHHLSADFEIASAATSTEEIGNPVYPPAREELRRHGISCAGHHARQVTKADYDHYDYLIVMDRMNVRNLSRMIGDDPMGKVKKLRSFAGNAGDIEDPWYTGAFGEVYGQILEGCSALLKQLYPEVSV